MGQLLWLGFANRIYHTFCFILFLASHRKCVNWYSNNLWENMFWFYLTYEENKKFINACAFSPYTPSDLETCDCLFDLFAWQTLNTAIFTPKTQVEKEGSSNKWKKEGRIISIKWCIDFPCESHLPLSLTYRTANEWNLVYLVQIENKNKKFFLWLQNALWSGLYKICSYFTF